MITNFRMDLRFSNLNTVTFAELYCLPMTMLCAVEGVTRAGVVDAAGVAWKSASEMGHSG